MSSSSTGTSLETGQKALFDWEDHARQTLEKVFWPWDKCLWFRNLREVYLVKAKGKTSAKEEDLFPPELSEAIRTMKAKVTLLAPERKVVHVWKKNHSGKPMVQITTESSQNPLNGGHFGLIFSFVPYGTTETVIKLQRFEHVKKPLDIYSYLMEIFMAVIIQSRSLSCTPRLLDVVRTKAGDIGCVMEKLGITLSTFFLYGLGAQDYISGLLILLEMAEKLYRLQSCFEFRHRDFRMKNVMLTNFKGAPHSDCVRIIDLGKTSIVFRKKEFSAYSGFLYQTISSDFDLGFFFADMLLQFEQNKKNIRQLEMYESILLHFIQGIRYETLLHHKSYLASLMELVHLRPLKTRQFSTPEYVYRFLRFEIDSSQKRGKKEKKETYRM